MSPGFRPLNLDTILQLRNLKGGSNFIDLYRSLRILLVLNFQLYMIQNPLGDKAGDSADEEIIWIIKFVRIIPS